MFFLLFQSSFSQLNYIPESQPLFEKETDINDKSAISTAVPASSVNDSPRDTPMVLRGKDSVGAGMEAVRAMYLHSGGMDSADKESPSSGPRDAVPFQTLPESPDVNKDLFNSLNAESQITHTPGAAAAAPAQEVTSSAAVLAIPEAETWIQCYDEESGWPYVYNEVTGEVKWVEPESTEQLMAELWEVCYDEAGNQFYYNSVTIFFLLYFLLYFYLLISLCANQSRQRECQAGSCQRTPKSQKEVTQVLGRG